MFSERKTDDLRNQLRYAEIRAVLIAAFSAYMLPDLGRELYTIAGLCCTNPVRDSSRESSVVAGPHEQTDTPRLQDQELAGL